MRINLPRGLISSLTAGLLFACTLTPNRAEAVIVVALDSGTDFAVGEKMNFAGNGTGDVSSSGHGNTVAQILFGSVPASEVGMYTVVTPDFVFSAASSDTAFATAAAKPEVKVIDLSNRNPVSKTVLQTGVDLGKLIVTNSGNRGGATDGIAVHAAEFDGAMLVVGAIGPDGAPEVYSNRGGPFFIWAPGFNGFTEVEGTSFAKPHVSGAAALLFTLFPNLTNKEVSAILLETATPLDANSGVLNVAEAIKPRDPVTVPTSDSGGGGSGAGIFAVVGGIALITAVVKGRQGELETTLVLDKYDRAYTLDLTQAIGIRDYRGTIGSILKSLNTFDKTFSYDNSPDSDTFVRITKPIQENMPGYNPAYWLNNDETLQVEPRFSFIHSTSDGKGYRFHINNSAASGFGALGLASRSNDPIEFLTNTSFSTPFLGFSANGFASQTIHPLSENTRFSVGLAAVDENIRYGLESDAAIFELSHSGKRLGGSVYFGRLSEQGSLFGGSSGGVFSVDKNKTHSLGLSANYRITEATHLLGNYTHGFSKVDETDNSLLDNFSSLESNSWGLGLVVDDTFRRGDRIGLGVSQPLRVTGGSADLTIPHSIDLNEVVSSSTERISLSPPGRETTFEVFYRMRLGKNAKFTTFLMHQREPDHDNQASDETSVLGMFQYQF